MRMQTDTQNPNLNLSRQINVSVGKVGHFVAVSVRILYVTSPYLAYSLTFAAAALAGMTLPKSTTTIQTFFLPRPEMSLNRRIGNQREKETVLNGFLF